jgi:hypothetical protein
MYKIKFKSQRGALVESGSYLACAASCADAEALIATHLPFSPSTATFETSRVKPSIYELNRYEKWLDDQPQNVSGIGIVYPVPRPAMSPTPPRLYEIEATASIIAHSESTAIRRFTEAVVEHVSAGRFTPSHHIHDLSVMIGEKPAPPRKTSRFDAQSGYKEHRFFQGGAARPK